MIGLDTNVLVRYLAQDDPVQSPQATALIETLSELEPGFVSQIALTEMVWVLMRSYKQTKAEIVVILNTLVRTRTLKIEGVAKVLLAVRAFEAGKADFSDCLIEQAGRAAGCRHTVTFDLNASNFTGMVKIS